ncbi:alpha-amylase [Podospora aff. communis PSN243]|uniref:Alpha-amylase n=1 Tax=Podospora aff. communis PSN243 TaxID=3040156 RepID=A0AAV9FXR3_9PEZI|nr:alpha-amylase [Podospora aff. communis PSN243]
MANNSNMGERRAPTAAAPRGGPFRVRSANLTPQRWTWWQDAVVYQIFVASFKDTNGDGYGDLGGVIEKLDYLVDLGVNIIWLSPIFESPMYDLGYDIADYYSINPVFGNMQDFDNLLEQAHQNGVRVILDIALNHTSVNHAWFRNSVMAVAGQRGPGDEYFKDFYIWGDPIVDEGGNTRPPSNWASVFDGCMWEWVPEIRKYYLHVFGKAQPDLNWENSDVRKELWKVLRFWLDKGVDGFRLDAINCMSKTHNEDLNDERPGRPTPSGWPDAPISEPGRLEQKADDMFANGPCVHEYLEEMYQQVFSRYDALSLGEMSCGITPEIGPDFIQRKPNQQQLDLILHFEHVELDCVDGDKWVLRDWKLPELKAAVDKWQTCMAEAGGWDTVWIENHDQPRGTSRFCKEAKRSRQDVAKLLAMWLFTLQGTVIIFQGQELGMTNPDEFSEEMIQDIETRLYWNQSHANLCEHGESGARALQMAKEAITSKGRDAARIPIPWNSDQKTSGGFTNHTKAKPWLPVHPHFAVLCAQAQRQDPASVWSFHRDMMRLRRQHPGLLSFPAHIVTKPGLRSMGGGKAVLIAASVRQIYGAYHLLDEHHPYVFAYSRIHGKESYLIVLNFGREAVEWDAPQMQGEGWAPLKFTSDHQFSGQDLTTVRLGPYEGVFHNVKTLQTLNKYSLYKLHSFD